MIVSNETTEHLSCMSGAHFRKLSIFAPLIS